jgi:superfamily I DNA/RNA helicase
MENKTTTKSSKGGIYIGTAHQSKGLEWKVVFVVSMNDGHFPIISRSNHDKNMEEERRICYVAFSRAKEQLHLSYYITNPSNNAQEIECSRFIKEICSSSSSSSSPSSPPSLPSSLYFYYFFFKYKKKKLYQKNQQQ